MPKLGVAAGAAIAALLGILGFTGSAVAYPDGQQSLTVDRQVLFGGDSFTASASAAVDCGWTLSWNGETREGSGPRFSATFVAPQVTEIEKFDLVGTCTYDDVEGGVAKAAAATWQKTITLTVRPGANGVAAPGETSGSLPGTGGPNVAVLFGGLVLVLSGAIAVAVARRSADEAEVPVPTA